MSESDSSAPAPSPVRRQLMVLGTAGVLAAGLGAGVAWWRSRPSAADLEAARRFWTLSFETPKGGAPLAMASFQGKPLLLNFWATWCAPCIEEMPMLDAFYRQRAANGWQVVGMAIDQPSSVRRFLERTPVTFPIALGGLEGSDLSRSLGNQAGGLPFSVVFGADGSVLRRRMGRVSEADLQTWAGLA